MRRETSARVPPVGSISGARVIDAIDTSGEDVGMPARSPAPRPRLDECRSVRIVTFPGMQGLDLVGPFEVFAGAADLIAAAGDGPRAYDVRAISRSGGMVTTE